MNGNETRDMRSKTSCKLETVPLGMLKLAQGSPQGNSGNQKPNKAEVQQQQTAAGASESPPGQEGRSRVGTCCLQIPLQ
ncbi:hypothetical protein VTJ04DRAFT_615 [Mycothermus thermophilus]|uniref:uncharacterized protein n=1 Tax=Humicola insolens TaxID=85995 RepID=UPI003742684A